MDWAGKRVLVTGAGGFIGSHLAERLVSEGADVRALVHYNSNGSCGWLDRSPARARMSVVAGDVRDPDRVRAVIADREFVFHLAALIGIPYSYETPLAYVRTNIEGTVNVLQAARAEACERVVLTSTSEVYGTARYVPIDEAHPLQGQSPYSASKIGADKLAESFHAAYGMPVTTVRPFNTYGPRQSARAVIPAIISQALLSPEIRLGNLESTRDMTYVDDTVDGFLKVAASREAIGQAHNLGTGKDHSIRDIATRILRILGIEKPIVLDAVRVRPGASEVERLRSDPSRTHKLTGWAANVELDDGLARTIRWISVNADAFKANQYAV